MLILKHIALRITTHKSGISVHVATPLLSEQTSSNSPQTILLVYNTTEPFPWFLIGQLVMRRVKLLRTKRITYVERIPHVLISKTSLGIVASARTDTKGTHTSVAKVYIYIYIQFTYESLQQKLWYVWIKREVEG